MASINMDQTVKRKSTGTSYSLECTNQEIVKSKVISSQSEELNDLSITSTSRKKLFIPLITERRIQEIKNQFDLLLKNRYSSLYSYAHREGAIMSWPVWYTDGKFNNNLFYSCSMFFTKQEVLITRELTDKLLKIECLQDNGKFNISLLLYMSERYKEDKSLSEEEGFSQIIYHIEQSNKNWPEWIIDGKFNQEFYIAIHIHFYIQKKLVKQQKVSDIRDITIENEYDKWSVHDFCKEIKRSTRKIILGHESDILQMHTEKRWPEFNVNFQFNLPFFDYSYILLFLLNRPFIPINITYLRNIARFNRQEKFDVALFCRFVHAYKNDPHRMHDEDDFMQFLEEVSDDDLPNLPVDVDLALDKHKDEDENMPILQQNLFDASANTSWPEWKTDHVMNVEFYIHTRNIFVYKNKPITQEHLRYIRRSYRFTSYEKFNVKKFCDFSDKYMRNVSLIKLHLNFPDDDSNDIINWPDFYIDNKFNKPFCDHSRKLLVLLNQPLIQANIKYLRNIARFNSQGKFDVDLFCSLVTLYKSNTHRIHSMDDFIQFLKEVPNEDTVEQAKFSRSQNKIDATTLPVGGANNTHVVKYPLNSKTKGSFDISNNTTWPEWEINGQFNSLFYEHVCKFLYETNQLLTPCVVSKIRHTDIFFEQNEFSVNLFCSSINQFMIDENIVTSEILLSDDDITKWPEFYIDHQFNKKFFDHVHALFGILNLPVLVANIDFLLNKDKFHCHGKFNVDLFCHFVTAYKNSNRIHSNRDFLLFLKTEHIDFNQSEKEKSSDS